ncbi:MAG: hypothetical protein ACKO8Z_16805 [Prosthecobacter sp.]
MKTTPAVTITFQVWLSLIACQIIFLFILSNREPHDGYQSMTETFALLSGSIAAMSFVMRHLLFSGFRSGKLTLVTAQGQASYITGHVVLFALSEVIGVLGFVNGLGSASKHEWLPFIAGAIVLLIVHIPLPFRFRPQNIRL